MNHREERSSSRVIMPLPEKPITYPYSNWHNNENETITLNGPFNNASLNII